MSKATWLGLYLFLVFIFSILYCFLWNHSPDNFIVNTELNMTPFEGVRSALWDGEGYKATTPTALNELENKLKTFLDEISDLDKRSEEIELNLIKIQMAQKDAYSKLKEERILGIEKYRKSELSGYEDKERSYLKELSLKEENLRNFQDPISRYPLIVELGNLRVEYAEFKVTFAQKRYDVESYITSNYGYFGSDETMNLFKNFQKQEIEAREKASNYYKKARDVREEISNLMKLNYEQRISRLGYVDFLYFSIGISTTTTFGDIIANSKVARAFVSIQLVFCVIVLGGFISKITSPKS